MEYGGWGSRRKEHREAQSITPLFSQHSYYELFQNTLATSVGADLSCPPPIYRPPWSDLLVKAHYIVGFAYFSAKSPMTGSLKYLPWKALINSTIQRTKAAIPTNQNRQPNKKARPPMKATRKTKSNIHKTI